VDFRYQFPFKNKKDLLGFELIPLFIFPALTILLFHGQPRDRADGVL
jgi:hypothetical protein